MAKKLKVEIQGRAVGAYGGPGGRGRIIAVSYCIAIPLDKPVSPVERSVFELRDVFRFEGDEKARAFVRELSASIREIVPGPNLSLKVEWGEWAGPEEHRYWGRRDWVL